MAAVINALWEQGDKGLMIMPASIPLHEPTVQAELTRYLEQKWDAIISADVDGPNATPLAVDRENPNLQRYGAARRVARTIFMASAPTYGGPNPGIDDRRIRLGCAQPGETPGSFGDALRRLADRATYLYVDGGRYWLSTQPSVTRTADDRAAALQADDVWAELIRRLQADRERGPFRSVHVVPESSGDVPDEMEARLVVLGPDYPHDTTGESKAKAAAEELLTRRGQQPRIFRNALLFLAPDQRRLGELSRPCACAWRGARSCRTRRPSTSMLSSAARRIARRSSGTRRSTPASARPGCGRWRLISPTRSSLGSIGRSIASAVRIRSPGAPQALRGRRGPPYPVRRSATACALDQFGLWRDREHVEIKQLIADFATFIYLPRLRIGSSLSMPSGRRSASCYAITSPTRTATMLLPNATSV